MKTYSELSRTERIDRVMTTRRQDITLVLEDLIEDQNISAILRSAESFGVGRVLIVHSGSKPKLSKNVSSGATKWIEIKYYKSITTCINLLKREGFVTVGALVEPTSQPLWNTKFNGKVAIVMGNEPKGLSEKAQKLVDKNIYIPMFGLTESLNVSVAAGIFLYEVIRQKEKNETPRL